jgi:TPR repeat protein
MRVWENILETSADIAKMDVVDEPEKTLSQGEAASGPATEESGETAEPKPLTGSENFQGNDTQVDHKGTLKLIEKAAAKDSLDAIITLARVYGMSRSKNPDESVALKLHETIVNLERDDDSAPKEGPKTLPAIPEDPLKAAQHFKKGAELGSPLSLAFLGLYFLLGEGVKRNEKIATVLFQKAISFGGSESKLLLGLCQIKNSGNPINKSAATDLFRKASVLSEADAKYKLGECHFYGRGAKEDKEKAISLFREAASQGLSEAQFTLGNLYLNGVFVEKDLGEAISLYKEAASLYYGPSLETLSKLFYCGGYAPDNPENIIALITRGVKMQSSWCQFVLGMCYREGKAVNKNNAMAFRLVEKAALSGLPVAMKNLAKFYEEGFGVPKDDKKAEEWREKRQALISQERPGLEENSLLLDRLDPEGEPSKNSL